VRSAFVRYAHEDQEFVLALVETSFRPTFDFLQRRADAGNAGLGGARQRNHKIGTLSA
jgi:hypothetical protein